MEKEVAGICKEKEKGKQHAILELAIKKKKKKKKVMDLQERKQQH